MALFPFTKMELNQEKIPTVDTDKHLSETGMFTQTLSPYPSCCVWEKQDWGTDSESLCPCYESSGDRWSLHPH